MKKYSHYTRKYIENFSLVNRVVWLTVKYNLALRIMTNKQLAHYIAKCNNNVVEKEFSQDELKPFYRINRKIEKIIANLPLRKTCLIRGLVKWHYFSYTNTNVKLSLLVSKSEFELKAHAELNILNKKFQDLGIVLN